MDGKTILVIEDDDASRMGFGLILREHGYSVELVASGRQGLEYLDKHGAPDLILLDMLMRDMDGWQFLKHRGARTSDVPVLIVTALAVASDEWAASLGAWGKLQKPIHEVALLEQVRKCIGPPQ